MDCAVPSCTKHALAASFGACITCWRRFCGVHYKDADAHECYKLSKAARARLRQGIEQSANDENIKLINVSSICAQATTFRPGRTCTGPLDPLQPGVNLIGQSNFHFKITWDDGVKWMVRIRRRLWDGPPLEALRMNMRNEIAALKVMKEGGVAVPGAWAASEDNSSQSELLYFFEEFLEGTPLDVRQDLAILSNSDYATMHSLAKWFCSLSNISFPAFGSPMPANDGIVIIGPMIRYHAAYPYPPYYLGPYHTAKEMYLGHLDLYIQQVLDGERYQPLLEVNGYLALLEVRSLVAGCDELDGMGGRNKHGSDKGDHVMISTGEGGAGYLKHGDDKGDHIMVSPKGDVTGLFDWEWAFVTSKSDAFAAPFGLADSAFLKAGSNALSAREQTLTAAYISLNRPDMAECVVKGKKFQRLYYFMRYELVRHVQLNALRRAFLGLGEEEGGDEPKSLEEWVRVAKGRFEGDEGLMMLEARAASAGAR